MKKNQRLYLFTMLSGITILLGEMINPGYLAVFWMTLGFLGWVIGGFCFICSSGGQR